MNMKLNVAVAAALVAAASSAQAGITIPAGDWTLDIGGVVNAYYTQTTYSGDNSGAAPLGLGNGKGDSTSNITTGLLPNYLSVSGKTRQNDLDVGFTISINPGASTNRALFQSSQQENRQAFLTFGDASWGSIKLGKDLGIFASDAILNDMTLLGVGGGAGNLAGNTTTLGRIGSGYIYADWKSQVAYTSPNWNGFQFTGGVTQSWDAQTAGIAAVGSATSTDRGGSQPAFEGKASYEWTGDVAGKVWVSAISQKVKGLTNATADAIVGGVIVPGTANTITSSSDRATAWDIGTTVNLAGFGLTGYYYDGKGIGQTGQLWDGFDAAGKRRDSKGGYVQGTYTVPEVGTKLGLSWGQSKLEGNSVDAFDNLKNEMWTVGAYHPLTKHLNLVAEYSQTKQKLEQTGGDLDAKAKTVSLGAILFF
ncbi:Outer membrane protein (porin) [Methylophilus rhizosphaerae]|uniref:Outer membrane protein (Porin) n=1 Tax=Methylophilus rhizosphaerae TaxID=492660 RepID=A0A1G9EE57_9PROT|nr:porin [Methylophilus rhizosphaerae]SDK74363.1 Outer membrane protein (porin) [Methylophilus rhizosphaerae]